MARITVEDCLTQENNRFALVILAAKRTKQLLDGSPALVASKNKPIVSSLREIASGKVRFMTEDEVQAEEQRLDDERQARLAALERPEPPKAENGSHAITLEAKAPESEEISSDPTEDAK